MRTLRRAVVLILLTMLALPVASRLATPPCTDMVGHFPTAVVLGGGVLGPETLDPGSMARTEAGIGLFETGRVETVIFTGDGMTGAPAVAELMRRRAVAAGLPAESLATEVRSRSTLQNALFTRDMVSGPFVLITDGYHAWRGWLSFAWAGAPPDGLCRTVRPAPAGTEEYLREAAAWPVNLLRAALWSAAAALGQTGTLPQQFLA